MACSLALHLLEEVLTKCEVPEPASETGLNVAVVSDGRPEIERLTVPVKPFCAVTVTVNVALWPCPMSFEIGETEIVKSPTWTEMLVLSTGSRLLTMSSERNLTVVVEETVKGPEYTLLLVVGSLPFVV